MLNKTPKVKGAVSIDSFGAKGTLKTYEDNFTAHLSIKFILCASE
jgi:hypothetical protein